MKPPAFQFYARDWLSSTLGMPWDVAGVYIHLLAWSWDNGPLPNSARWRQRILGPEAGRLWIAIKPRWQSIKKGWINPRLEHQRSVQASFAERGAKGAKVRWQPSLSHIAKPWPASASASASADQDHLNKPRASRALATDDFGAFWQAYPKKTGKAAALKAWQKTKPPLAQVLEALTWQTQSLQWNRDEGRYRPNPATYLNQGRWQDEPEQPAQHIGQKSRTGDTVNAARAYLQESLRGKS